MLQTNNMPQWRPGKNGFYEVWYFKLNQTHRGPALWLRLTLLVNRGGDRQLAETWGIFFDPQSWGSGHVAVKESFGLDAFVSTPDRIQIGNCYWAENKTAGKICSGGHEIRWELDFTQNQIGFDPVPAGFKKLRLNKSTAYTPNPDLEFSGHFWVDGTEYPCKRSRGMQGHVFGSRQAVNWAWAHANSADDRTPFVFEALTAQIKMGGLFTSPKLSVLFFEFAGQRHEWNTVRDALNIRSRYSLDGWEFSANKHDLKLTGKISGRVGDFAGVTYEDTDGSRLFCRNSKVADLELTVRCGDSAETVLQSSRTCAFEIVERKNDERVKVLI